MSEKHNKICKYLNYVEHLLIFVFIVTGSVPIFQFASLVCALIGNASSAVGIKTYEITAGIKKYKSIMKKKKKHDKIVLFRKDKLNTFEVIVSKALIDSVMTNFFSN